MATTTTKHLLQHPSHKHPLELRDLSSAPIAPVCFLCHRKISETEAYTCQEGCKTYYYHKVCVEASPQIDRHPLHPAHPLPLIHDQRAFLCDACGEGFDSGGSSFKCRECIFDLDICCALSRLSVEGGSQGGKAAEQITLPLHPHRLTSFFSRHDFVGDSNCYICGGRVEGDGYRCWQRSCEFIIHKGCIQDLYYADGNKAPRVYHRHPLEIFVGEDTGSRRCASCGSEESGEFIGCASCEVFYHRHCFQVPEILQFPSHNPDHNLAPFLDNGTLQQCQSCSSSLKEEIYYRCTLCEFVVHALCGFQAQTYVFGATITHPHHPDHPLTLLEEDDDDHYDLCKACGLLIVGDRKLSCKRCFDVDFHVKCADHFPTHKHYLHEHKLVRLDEYECWECNRCRTRKESPLFRCVPCNFNLHEDCMELPQVVRNDKIHWHPLTLHETFLEDKSGDYYCEHCENTRDPRLGVYVCEYCQISLPRIYHIHCVLPELEKVYAERRQPSAAFRKLLEQIADQRKEVRAIEEKLKEGKEMLKEAKEKLDELVKQGRELLDQEYVSTDSDNESCERFGE